MMTVSARGKAITCCVPNGGGKDHVRLGDGSSSGDSLLFENTKRRPVLRWPVSRVPRVGYQLSSATAI